MHVFFSAINRPSRKFVCLYFFLTFFIGFAYIVHCCVGTLWAEYLVNTFVYNPLLCTTLREREDWYRQRQPISQFMMVPRKIGEYHEDFNSITRDLVVLLRKLRDSQTCVIEDVLAQLSMWSFECKLLCSHSCILGTM